MRKFYFALSIVGLFSMTLVAQVSPRWTAVFNGTGDNSDHFNKVISDGTGNFIGVGYTIKKGNYKDVLVAKFKSSNGDTLWWRTKNGKGNGDDEAIAVGVDAGGNVFVTGFVDAGNSQDNIITMKFDSAGTALWDTTWDSPAMLDDDGADLKIDGNGNCIVGGNTKPDTISGNRDFAILKYSTTGQLIWATTWSNFGTGKDELAAIAVDNNNDIYAAGRSFGSTDDMILLQIDEVSGSVSWQIRYPGSGQDRTTCVAVDNAGDIIVAGSWENGNNDQDFRINKYSNSGSLIWPHTVITAYSGDDRPTAMYIDAADNIYVTGYADVAFGSAKNLDFQTVKYNSGGTQQWVRRDGNPMQQEDVPNDITVDANGNVYITGKSDSDPVTTFADFDYMTIAISAAGNSLLWGPEFHAGTAATKDDNATSIEYLNGSVYVSGGAVNTTTQKDATTIKYDASNGNVTWVKDLNGSGDFSDEAKAIVVDANNNSYVSGSTFEENHGLNACISKVDNAGNILCVYQYNGAKNDDDEFKSIALSQGGMIYAAGYTKVTDQKRNMLLVKWNPNSGNCNDTGWTRTYDYIGQNDRIEDMILDNAGNIYVTGRSDANLNDTIDNDDIVTIKYDSNGNVQWLTRYDGSAHLRDEPVKIIFDKVGDIIVGGRTENIQNDDFIIIKYNPVDGQIRPGFPVTYGINNDDRVTDIAVDSLNNIYVAGYSQMSAGNAIQDPRVIAFDAAGNILPAIVFVYSASGQDEFTKIQFDAYGDLYILNKYTDPGATILNYDYLLRKFHADMTPVWEKSYDSPIHANDDPVDMDITPNGDVYITGTSGDSIIGTSINQNWVTLGYDSAGNEIFMANADGPNSTDDSPNALTIKGSTIWVSGFTEGINNSQKDLTVISYDIPIINSVSAVNGNNNAVIYPNPFSENCLITFSSKGERNFQLFDVLGNKVMGDVQFNGNKLDLSRGNLSPGVYQYRISDSKNITTGKIIIN